MAAPFGEFDSVTTGRAHLADSLNSVGGYARARPHPLPIPFIFHIPVGDKLCGEAYPDD